MASTNRADVSGNLVEVASGAGFATWRRERPAGTLKLHWSAQGAVRMHVDGCGAGAFAPLIIERYERAVRETGKVLILFDLEKMQNYDTELRATLTDWCLRHRKSISAMHLYARSKVVMMGARVANLVLGGLMQIHGERTSFDPVVREGGLAPVPT
jgi:hypothetical protein